MPTSLLGPLQRMLLIAVFAAGFSSCVGIASADNLTPFGAADDFAAPPMDSAFTNGLAVMKRASGFQEVNPIGVSPDWKPNLCLLLGFRVDKGSERFVRLVELSTLPPPTHVAGENNATPHATFEFTAEASKQCPTSRVYRLISPRHPVRVRVFSEQGQLLTESREALAWQFLTNGLVEACVTRKTIREDSTAASNSPISAPATGAGVEASSTGHDSWSLEAEAAAMRGLAALVALFGDTLACKALEDVRDRAIQVARPPNLLKAILARGLTLNLTPRFERATILPAAGGVPDGTRVRFPAELWQGKRLLVSVQFVADSTGGAHALTAGVRAIRAVHPMKPERRLLAQVLAAGTLAAKPDLASNASVGVVRP